MVSITLKKTYSRLLEIKTLIGFHSTSILFINHIWYALTINQSSTVSVSIVKFSDNS